MADWVSDVRQLVGTRPLILVAAGVIVKDASGAILLQHRADGTGWGIPGGAMDLGETLEDTARRELLEETGLVAGELALLDVYSGPEFFLEYPSGDQAYVVGATFLARQVQGDACPDGVEGVELRYFPTAALPAGLNAYNRRLLDRCLARL